MSSNSETSGGAATEPIKIKRPKKWIKPVVIVLILAAIGAGACWFFFLRGGDEEESSLYIEDVVIRSDIVSNLTCTGTLEPADSYKVTSLVKGDILNAGFEEGDTLKKDDVLYVIDSAAVTKNVEQAEHALEKAEHSLAQAQQHMGDLSVVSTGSGTVAELKAEVGDDVSSGMALAVIQDSSVMTIKLPFPADEAASFYVGQGAQVTVDGSYETIGGTVTAIAASDTVLSGSRIVRIVTIDVANPGGLTTGSSGSAMIGASACAESRAFGYKSEKTVTAKTSGRVVSRPVSEGMQVSAGQVLFVLSSEELNDSVTNAKDAIRDNEIALEKEKESLNDYTILSPIDGTIIDKKYKKGEKIPEAGKELCTIFDLSYLSFIMHVDELEIKKVAEGQEVSITSEALPGAYFEGVITKISINGTTNNGATSYPVTVRIDDYGELLPGMNVDAVVTLAEANEVLAVPTEAVARGNQILVKTNGPDAAAPDNEEGIPAGYEWRDVELGLDDGFYIEIVSGLEEGDEIAYITGMGGDVEVNSSGDYVIEVG